MKNYKSISVFLPVLNEQENIKSCIYSVKKYLNKRFKNYEIIVVSNGSTDSTEKITKALAEKDKHIKSIHGKKKGYGRALRAGFAYSTKELIFYMDGDNQFKINDLDKLLPVLESHDIVSAYRIKRQDPWMRIFFATVYNLIIKILFNLKVRDIDCAFKLYKKEIFEKIKLKANTGFIDAEVLIKAKKNGFSIGQVGISHYPRTSGKTIYAMGNVGLAIVRPKVVIDILKEIKLLWKELR
jgi:glycosyltransferase involved in cell wall biosynthesis